MMTSFFKPALIGAMLLAATGASASGQGRMGALPDFEALDSAGTGQITPEQFQSLMQTPQEWMVARLMEQANDDGLLDEAALRAGLASLRPEGRGGENRGARLFSRIDSNNDGVIDADEYARFSDRMTERAEKHQRPRGRW
jgi:Ca2+-binding EF-hand superfamily protein